MIVYGSVADKDVDSVMHLMPVGATYIFTQAQSKRAMAADKISQKFQDYCTENGRNVGQIYVKETVVEAVSLAREIAAGMLVETPEAKPVIYIGGSTYVVSEAMAMLKV